MNKRYILVRDKIVVDIDKDKKKIIDYRDNVDDVLIQENVVEKIEGQLKFVETSIKDLQNSVDKDKYSIKDLLLFLTLPTITFVFFRAISLGIDNTLINTFLGNLSQTTAALIYASPFILLLSSFLVSVNHIPRRLYIKRIKGFQAQFEGLTTQLEVEKTHLKELINKKTQNNMRDITNSNDVKIKIVDDKIALDYVDSMIEAYHLCGVKEKAFLKAYKQSLLDEKIRRKYTEFEQNIIKGYVKQKVKKLSA